MLNQKSFTSKYLENTSARVAKREMLPLGDLEDEISDEAALKKNQHDKIANYVSKNPIDAAKLINSWLHEEQEI